MHIRQFALIAARGAAPSLLAIMRHGRARVVVCDLSNVLLAHADSCMDRRRGLTDPLDGGRSRPGPAVEHMTLDEWIQRECISAAGRRAVTRGPGKKFIRLSDLELVDEPTNGFYGVLGYPRTINTPNYDTKEKGAHLPMGRVGAIQLSINPQTAEELRDGTQMPPGGQVVAMYGRGIQGGAASIEGMRPGAYMLCAVLGDPRVASSVKLKCTQVKLTAAAKQTASLVVPAAWVEGT